LLAQKHKELKFFAKQRKPTIKNPWIVQNEEEILATCSKLDLESAARLPPVRNWIWRGWRGCHLFEIGFGEGGVVATCLKLDLERAARLLLV
jgi:hypothetical protein